MMQTAGFLGTFKIALDKRAIRKYVNTIAKESKNRFIEGMHSEKSGRWYDGIRASAPGEYPAIRTGRLLNSIGTETTGNSVELGTNTEYSTDLAYGAYRLEPRLMSKSAMTSTIHNVIFKYPIRITRRV